MCRFGYGFAIVMEDIGGTAIKQLIPPDGFATDLFLQLAVRIGMSTNKKKKTVTTFSLQLFC